MTKFLKKVEYASTWADEEPEAWICGKWFVGFILVSKTEREESKNLWLVCSRTFYKSHVSHIEQTEGPKTITYWYREGCFWRLIYIKRSLPVPVGEMRPRQQETVDRILELLKTRSSMVCLLHGVPGGGKSMTALYVCRELLKEHKGVHLCDAHAPWEHGDNFDSFYNKINPSRDTPLVLVFEEVDGLITKVHNNSIVQGQHNPIQIKDKATLNMFFDKFPRDIYPWVILIMTTNRPTGFFDALDPSYMRPGRVDFKVEF